MRRVFRWKHLQIHGIQNEKKSLGKLPIQIMIYKKHDVQRELNQNRTSLMIFSSLIGSKKTINAFAESLCILYEKIFIVDFSTLVKSAKKNSVDTIIEAIQTLIYDENVRKFIFLDVSSMIFWKLIWLNQNLMDQSKIFFIRPIFNPSGLISPLSLKTLFAGGPFLLFRLRLLFYSSELRKMLNESNTATERQSILLNPNIGFILTRKSMDYTLENLLSKQEIYESKIIQFSTGGWSFYKQETLILGILHGFFNDFNNRIK